MTTTEKCSQKPKTVSVT